MMLCPNCKDDLEIDYTPEHNDRNPFEIVCYCCGWFAPKRYATEEAAQKAIRERPE